VRIGIDARYAFHDVEDGVGAYVASLLTHLPAVGRGEDRFVAYLDGATDTEGLDDLRVEIRQLPVANPFIWREGALPLAASRDRLDLLHLPGNYGPTWTPCPTVYTIHDPSKFVGSAPRRGRPSLRGTLAQALHIGTLPLQARGARRIITASDASRLDLIRLLGLEADRIHVIPLGVAKDLAPAANPGLVRERLWQAGYPVPKRFVLALADPDPGETGRVLMRSLARMHDLLPEVQLWIIGVERPEAYPLPFPSPPEWLTILGEVPRRALIGLFQAAEVFVYLRLTEDFSLRILEAMSCGLPVLAARRPSVMEAAGNAAVLFDPENDEDLAGGLVHLLTNDVIRTSCIQAGRAHASRFSEVEMVRRTYSVYRDAVYEASREAAEGQAE
jgi:glycosyltransferase involved in cell wall biosynthesis